MVIVVVNSNEELVCVNEYNETMVKKLDQMTPKDHFLFKLVDLGDPTYPGVLKRLRVYSSATKSPVVCRSTGVLTSSMATDI